MYSSKSVILDKPDLLPVKHIFKLNCCLVKSDEIYS